MERSYLYGEDEFVIMIGGLHIEMAVLKLIGHWLNGSGWDSALVQADITTRGHADAILKASHIIRSRYAHQISACALYILQKNAFEQYVNNSTSNDQSFLSGRGKKTAWNVWKSMPHLTPTLQKLSSPQIKVAEEDVHTMEQFVIRQYIRTCSEINKVNEARQVLFSQGIRSIENVPPTKDALEQHVKRAAYQSCQVWGQTLDPIQQLPSPSGWGWSKCDDNSWKPVWTTIPKAAKACSELIRCGCKKACRGLCKCTKANLSCSALCHCAGNCFQQ